MLTNSLGGFLPEFNLYTPVYKHYALVQVWTVYIGMYIHMLTQTSR